MFEDVGGICVPPKWPLLRFDSSVLPHYAPQINHGSSRTAHLNERWVTVPLYEVASRDSRRRYDVRFDSPEAFRAALRLSPKTHIILTSVTPDCHIEDFWEEHQVKDLTGKLSKLGISAMTVPNYSFMLDVPRSNSLYNLSRMFRMSERISAAGIPTILHLNASTKRDWERWRDILREQSHTTCVSLEFQTGPSTRSIGDRYFSGLVALRDSLGRDIHPLVLAGAGRMKQLQECFPNHFTVVDATPFVKTMQRQMLKTNGSFWKWKPVRSGLGESLHHRLATNIRLHRRRLMQRIALDDDGNPLLFAQAA
jgi:hypothetical protein